MPSCSDHWHCLTCVSLLKVLWKLHSCSFIQPNDADCKSRLHCNQIHTLALGILVTEIVVYQLWAVTDALAILVKIACVYCSIVVLFWMIYASSLVVAEHLNLCWNNCAIWFLFKREDMYEKEHSWMRGTIKRAI